MNRDTLKNLRSLVNSPLWLGFEDVLKSELEAQYKILEHSNDPIHISRAQGAVSLLKKFLILRQEADRKNDA